MAEREVVWTDTAAKQRREVLTYWKEKNRSASYPMKLITLIRKRVNLISQFPESGQDVDFPETKVSAMGHFSLFYQVTSHQIIITAFWDNRQDPKKLLNILKSSNQ